MVRDSRSGAATLARLAAQARGVRPTTELGQQYRTARHSEVSTWCGSNAGGRGPVKGRSGLLAASGRTAARTMQHQCLMKILQFVC